jgi:hypothetical protein
LKKHGIFTVSPSYPKLFYHPTKLEMRRGGNPASLRGTIREILKKTVMTYEIYFGSGARGSVRDCSEKPTARAGIAGGKSEDL